MDHPDMERRALLGRLIAAGCVAALPPLAGCEKPPPPKVSDQPAEPPAPTPPAAVAEAPTQPANGKARKDQVAYQDQPKGDQKCSACLHFIAESNTCKVVQGNVSPLGWCKLWAARPPAT